MAKRWGEAPVLLAIAAVLVIGLMTLAALGPALDRPAPEEDDTQKPQKTAVLVEADCGLLQRFASLEELEEYLRNDDQYYYSWGPGVFLEGDVRVAEGDTALLGGAQDSGRDFSGTNTQVAGVDEDDLVKTDGTYLYVISQGDVVILKAYPAGDAAIVARIDAGGAASGLFLSGDRLVVISSWTAAAPVLGSYMWWGSYPQQTGLKVYDVSDPAAPEMLQSVRIPGGYFGARMIEDHVYFLVTNYLWSWEGGVVLPTMYVNDASIELEATDIGYFEDEGSAHTLLTVAAIDVNDADSFTFDAFLIDWATSLYASQDHIFIAVGGAFTVFGTTVVSTGAPIAGTTVHRVAIDAGQIGYACSGWAPGYVLNQFSMDEFEGYFRMATTAWTNVDGQTNAVYVFDSHMDLIGGLEGIAPGESLYSARFAGDRAYLVTFRVIDPFFVIDLSTPAEPELLGELEIPGFSTYLHPYDEDHIIGLGMQDTNVKLSLFDVTDVTEPKEMSKLILDATHSTALYDHKAFLFDREKNLLVLPAMTAEWTAERYHTWSGAYVFEVTLHSGFVLQGKITHFDEDTNDDRYWWGYSPYTILRSLYIEENLYTVSGALVKIHDLDTLDELATIEL